MAISVADNFSYQGSKPLDARVKFDTVANMKTFAESKLYDGCFAYVTGTKKYYSFDSTNTVDPDTGKWREYSTGGSYVLPIASDEVLGGIKVGDNLEIGDDGALNAILPVVDLSNEINGHNVYSTTEKLIGQWIDGKPLYQKIIQSVSGGIDANTWISIGSLGVGNNVVDKIIVLKGMITNSTDTDFYTVPQKTIGISYNKSTDTIKIYCDSDWIHKPFYVVAQYTKTTDSAQSIGSINEYSTTEKIVGTWIDGKPLYEKTLTDLHVNIPSMSWIDTGLVIPNGKKCINAICRGETTIIIASVEIASADGKVYLMGMRNATTVLTEITLQYIKTTD